MRPHLLLAMTLIAAEVYLCAHLTQYGPFPPGTRPGLFPVHDLVALPSNDANFYLVEMSGPRGTKAPMIQASQRKTDDGVDLSVLTFDRKRLSGPFHVSSSLLKPYGYSADLNGDGVLDYILTIHHGTVGAIGGGLEDVVFVLSTGDRYAVSMVTSLYVGPHDFLNVSGHFHFLHTTVFGVTEQVRGKDGLHHNYWIYNLLDLNGAMVRLNNSTMSGFPKWVFWTFAANHDETDQFTSEQKAQLFDPDRICIVSTPDHPCSDYFQ